LVSDLLDFDRNGRNWPNRDASMFVSAAGLRWHVQVMGQGPVLLLLHGTGAATHSWAGLAPLLSHSFRVVAPDLPGHGFTSLAGAEHSSLPGMAHAVASLLEELGMAPTLVIGHSAGAAILARMCLDNSISPVALIALNGALLPLHGMHGWLYSGSARLLASIALVPRLFARRAADRRVVERLISQTGSLPPASTVDCYAMLLRSEKHVSAALRMMANWDLEPLARELLGLHPELHLIACEGDRTIPVSHARRICTLMPRARLHLIESLGHLAHEENPTLIHEAILSVTSGLDL
jgi:magnesium chelatase accessory protein